MTFLVPGFVLPHDQLAILLVISCEEDMAARLVKEPGGAPMGAYG